MAAPAKSLPIHGPRVERRKDRVSDDVGEVRSNELVFAVVAHVGSGATWVAAKLAAELSSADFGFHPVNLKISRLLAERGGYRREPHTISDVHRLQTIGDELRKNHGDSIGAGLVIDQIYQHRQAPPPAEGARKPFAFIIDSLKHPAEVDVLRRVYGSSFYLVSVVCNDDVRERRLELKFKADAQTPERVRKIMAEDEAGSEDYGQHVRKTLRLGDMFVVNNDDDRRLADDIRRFLEAITGTKLVRPTTEERGMHAAWSAALRSACLSRQVGASIVARSGQILATGTNDPPAPGGGLYHEGSNPDFRCFHWNGEVDLRGCRNDKTKANIYASIHREFRSAGLIGDGVTVDQVVAALSRTRVRDLIEFSRAIHAEMDAFMSMIRSPTESPVGATLYCTTYPCHSCARHIVAAGIREVVYIEPYTKSLAVELHPDAIREILAPSSAPPENIVQFRLFSGIAPRRFAALFESRGGWKDESGGVKRRNAGEHVDPILKRSFMDLEQKLAETIQSELERGD